MGFTAGPGIAEACGAGRPENPRAGCPTSSTHVGRSSRPREDAIFLAAMAANEPLGGPLQRRQTFSGLHSGDHRRPAHLAESLPRGCRVERFIGLSEAAA